MAVSDLHLGALNSVLTAVAEDGSGVDPKGVSPVMAPLAECIRQLSGAGDDKAELVVLGDLFELALTTTEIAGATFGQFVRALRIGLDDAFVCPRVRFIPGNHDHRLWTQARDAHYLLELKDRAGDDEALPEARHITQLLPELQRFPVRDAFVELLAARSEPEAKIVVEQSYPSLGMIADGGRRGVVLSHGHYIEPLYRLMSNLDIAFGLKPANELAPAEHIEADNGGWIDFFWSSMGDSGDVTGVVRSLYESLQSKEAMDAEIEAIKRFIAARYPGPRGFIESRVVAAGLRREVGARLQRERHQPEVVLSKGASQGLSEFISGPVHHQLGRNKAEHTTFVFGHTHKPFTETLSVENFSNPVSVVNTGGWVVDSIEPEATKGAALVLVDWHANVAVVRCYLQGDGIDNYRVTVSDANLDGRENKLADELSSSIDPSRDPWLSLGQALRETVTVRARQLRDRLATSAATLDQEGIR